MKPINQTISQKVINNGSLASSQTHSSHGSMESGNSQIVASIYRMGPKIGAGNFGELYLGINIVTKIKIAIKRERVRSRSPQLHLEGKFYKLLGNNEGIPLVYYFEKGRRYNSLVMELLGPNLEEIFNATHRKFSVYTALRIAMQLIRRIQYVHSKGIIYRDIKPENFLLGAKRSTKEIIYIVDFGLAKEYLLPSTRNHIPFSEKRNLTGTARYMSINTHLGYEQSRRDDLESLGHMILYFVKGSLPWQGLKAETVKDRYVKIGEVKRSISLNKLCSGLPDEFVTYMRYARGLDFFQNPDYDYLFNLFFSLLKRMKLDDVELDWVIPSVPYLNVLNAFDAEIKMFDTENLNCGSSKRNAVRKSGDRKSENGVKCQKILVAADVHPLVSANKNDLKAHKAVIDDQQKRGIFRCCLPFQKNKKDSQRPSNSNSKQLEESNPM